MLSTTGIELQLRTAQVFTLCLFLFVTCKAEKIRYASTVECDRYSLDAVYFEKFQPITDNIISDNLEFVNRVTDLMVDSVTKLLAAMPGRTASDKEEKRVHDLFRTLKTTFSGKIRHSQANLTAAWEAYLTSYFDLLIDNDESSLADFLSKTDRVGDMYSYSRTTMDQKLGEVVSFAKRTVRNGLGGIIAAAEEDLKKHASEGNGTESKGKDKEDPEEYRRKKQIEIAEMIVPGFLHTVTQRVLQRDVDLFKKVTTTADGRDSDFDDLIFDLTLIRHRVHSIIRDDLPKDKGSTDLARRSIYTYFAELSNKMYKKKIEDSHIGRKYNRKSMANEEQLADTLIELMEVYP